MTSYALSRVPVKPLYNTSIKIFIPPLSMLYLQKVLLVHSKKCVFYIMYELKLPLCVSFKVTHNTCSLHLVSNFQNSSKHTKPSIENSTSLW